MIKLHTNFGLITLELDAEKAPETTKNFLAYVEAGHYDNTVFHRVIKNFMIQGGDPTGTGRGGDAGSEVATGVIGDEALQMVSGEGDEFAAREVPDGRRDTPSAPVEVALVGDPDAFGALIEAIAAATVDYLSAQIAAGVEARTPGLHRDDRHAVILSSR